jgi:drug/metabolite transporter (DMT)-like permease
MAALLALGAAAAYGAGDFLGGIASRRAPATAVVLWSHVVGLLLMLATAPLVGGEVTTQALMVGAAAGLVGVAGVTLFYRALAVGSMSVVAPVAGLLSAAVPVVAGVGGGERPSTAALVGIVLALVAVTLVSRESEPEATRKTNASRGLGLALAAGLGFGLFFVALDGAGSGTGIWPLVGARLASVTLFTALGAARVTQVSPPREAALAAAGAGVLDAGANVMYVLALSHGLLSIVAVLTALYPAGTVVLARYVLCERMNRAQQAGLAFAGLAAGLIAL